MLQLCAILKRVAALQGTRARPQAARLANQELRASLHTRTRARVLQAPQHQLACTASRLMGVSSMARVLVTPTLHLGLQVLQHHQEASRHHHTANPL